METLTARLALVSGYPLKAIDKPSAGRYTTGRVLFSTNVYAPSCTVATTSTLVQAAPDTIVTRLLNVVAHAVFAAE